MSTTRSHFRPEPATDAVLVLTAHGERGGLGDNDSLRRCAERLRLLLPEHEVLHCVLNGTPSVDSALAHLPVETPLHILPFFLSDGYFTRCAIPQAFAAWENRRVHKPLGLMDGLTELIGDIARDGSGHLQRLPEEVNVLLAAHGSASNAQARQAIERQRKLLSQGGRFSEVRAAYLEEAPLLKHTLAELDQPTVVVGMFAGDGLHAAEDMPQLLHSAASDEVIYTGSIAGHVRVPVLLALEFLHAKGATDL